MNAADRPDTAALDTATFERNLIVILSETQDLVNIAGAVRAMMNMGVHRLRLVQPVEYDTYRIEGIAHGSASVLERVEFFDSLFDATADVTHVVGTSARRRTASFVWQHPRDAAPDVIDLLASGATVALVFGREDKGLANEDLDRCDRVLTIPTHHRHRSLNLAQAVLLVTYELWLAGPGAARPLPRARRSSPPATAREMEELFVDVERALETIDFFKARNAPTVMRTLRALARRAELESRQARQLRAMAIEVRKFLGRSGALDSQSRSDDGVDPIR